MIEGKQTIIPHGMTYPEAKRYLQKREVVKTLRREAIIPREQIDNKLDDHIQELETRTELLELVNEVCLWGLFIAGMAMLFTL